MTELLYLQNSELFEGVSKIMKESADSKGYYIIFDRTIFYPQGGGQPADQGIIQVEGHTYRVSDVRKIDKQIRHYVFEQVFGAESNAEVNIILDKERRLLNTRYHTAGHLLASVAESLFPEIRAIKGHQFPNEAYVEFKGIPKNDDFLVEQLYSELKNLTASGSEVQTFYLNTEELGELVELLPYQLLERQDIRVCKIGEFAPVPCGGTHVRNLNEIGEIIITKYKSKKGKMKISYEVQ